MKIALARMILVVSTTITLGCSTNEPSIEMILFGLEKSYVKNATQLQPMEEFFEEYNVSPQQFKEDSVEFAEAVNSFFASSPAIIEELLRFKDDTLKYCNWLGTKRPYSSTIQYGDLITRAQGAMALIDCYIVSRNKELIVRDYLRNIEFQPFAEFLKVRRNLSLVELRKEYLVFISKSM